MLGIGAYPLNSDNAFDTAFGPIVDPKMKNSI